MRISSDELVDAISELLNPIERRIVDWQKLGEKHCRVTFFDKNAPDKAKEREAEIKKDMLFSIVHKANNDLVIAHCNTEHRLSLSICLALFKKGLDVRCFGHDDDGRLKGIIFDTTVGDFCEFVKNLQSIADTFHLILCLSDNPLNDYQTGLFYARMKDIHGTAKLVGVLTNPGHIFRVTILDKTISLSFLVSQIDQRNCHLVVRGAVPTNSGRKVVTLYSCCP